MTRIYFNILSLGLTILTFNTVNAQSTNDSNYLKTLYKIQQSYLDGNIPDKSEFDNLLKRDLEKYFTDKYGQVTVKWEFLRDGPTQSGVSYPKYYLWTKINKGEKLLSEGAIRVAAIDKTRFDITNYVEINQIKEKSIDIYTIFPKAVCEKIESKVK